MADKKTQLEREAAAARDRHADEMARLLQAELIAHGIDLADGRPARRSRDREVPRVEMRFDGADTTNLEKMIILLRRARG